jgi:PQQ-dependent dehydrogenase (methanol/ethanol family)
MLVKRRLLWAAGAAAAVGLIGTMASGSGRSLAQTRGATSAEALKAGDWPLHNLDLQNGRFSPLEQINRANADKLTVKWSLDLPKSVSVGTATPIVVNGIMYFNAGPKLFAVDASSGRSIWTRELGTDQPEGGRGPAYGDRKVFFVGRSHLFAVDAETGAPVESFGSKGVLAVAGLALAFKDPGKYGPGFDPMDAGYMIASAPTYVDGTVYLGIAQADSLITGGLVVAIDGASGRLKWVFRAIPQGPQDDGWEIAKDTWSGPERRGGGIWTQPAVDPELGMVYVNVSNPTPNYDGSTRKGINLFTNSVVALNSATGKLMWHFQAIHHDIWDWDLVTGPTLFDTTVDGRRVKALASLAKTCYVYALDRETGRPIFPIVETPVPVTTDMPGEQVWPTQPIPYTARHVPQTPFCATYPPNVKDPELAARRRPSFHPYQVNEFVIVAPGLQGGPNRGSSSFSPRTGLLYVTGKNDAWSIKAKSVGNTLKAGPGVQGHFLNIQEDGKTGVTPTQNIAAYNPATGELAWVIERPNVTNGGNLVTAGDVVFQAIGRDFYALDATSGKQLAKVSIKIVTSATPLTYLADLRQFVAIASGNSVVALGLP